jgi:hypothetical protein
MEMDSPMLNVPVVSEAFSPPEDHPPRFQASSRVSTLGITGGPRRQRSRSNLRRARTLNQSGTGIRRHPSGSLLHVKNSKEVLRNRSAKKRSHAVPDLSTSGREGKHFTVGNVGNNGRLYLRYGNTQSLLMGPYDVRETEDGAKLNNLPLGRW